MTRTVEYYLDILYPDIDSASEAEKKKYKKDKEFITKYIDKVNSEYDSLSGNIERFGEKDFVILLIKYQKELWDEETIIVEYAKSIMKFLNKDSFISENFDYFLAAMYEERALEEKYKSSEKPTTPIDFGTIYDLSREFLKQIDSSGEMAKHLRLLMMQGNIQVHIPEEKIASSFNGRDGVINYSFDGTIADAYTLVHEFMHYWVDQKAHPTDDREKQSMLNEVETIFYEKAFALFLEKKGLLPDGADSILNMRHRREYEKDPNNCIIMFLELAKMIKENGEIDQDNIVDMLSSHFPEISDREDLWNKGKEILISFIDKHPLAFEMTDGPCMYRFNEILAMRMGYTHDSIRQMHTLSHLVIDRQNDHRFMEEYEKLRAKIHSKSIEAEDLSDSSSTQITKENLDEENR